MYVTLKYNNLILPSLLKDSWCKKLREKFKNCHRNDRAQKAGIVLPTKKSKIDIEEAELASESGTDMDVYKRNDMKLRNDFLSGKWSFNSLSILIEDTFKIRKQYLKEVHVAEVFERFQWMREPSLVS